jgi:hypothetical protein
MTHDEVAELLGAYVLDAVSPEERELVDAHLATCKACTEEVADLLTVHDRLASLAVERDPPPELRVRLMAMVEQDRAQWVHDQAGATPASPPLARASAPDVSWWDRLRQRLGRVPALAYGAGGALVVAAVIVIAVLVIRKSVTVQTYTAGPVAPVVSGIDLRGLTAQVDVRSNHITRVSFTNLPSLPRALAYQLWFLPETGKPIPVDGFVANAQGTWTKRYRQDSSGLQAVAVTIEQAPGNSTAPSKYLAVDVPLKG